MLTELHMTKFLPAILGLMLVPIFGCTTTQHGSLELPGITARNPAMQNQHAQVFQSQANSRQVAKPTMQTGSSDRDESTSASSNRQIVRGQDYGYQNGKIFNQSTGDQTQTGPLPTTDATKTDKNVQPIGNRTAQLPTGGDPYFQQPNLPQTSFQPPSSAPSNLTQAPPVLPGQSDGSAPYTAPAYNGPTYPTQQNQQAYPTQPAGYAPAGGDSTVYGRRTGPSNGRPGYDRQNFPQQNLYPPVGSGPYANSPGGALQLPPNFADINALLSEGQSGQIMLGAAVNSDAGVTGQFTISEKNFDISKFPRSPRDLFIDGNAFRGAGQGFRLEAMPGSEVQRYLLNFSEPYLFNTQVSLSTSAYYFTRNYFDYNEQRLGGRVSFGYRLTPDLSLSVGTRAENVKIFDPRVNTSPKLNRALGNNSLLMGEVTLAHDTRDHAFLATEGHYFEVGFKQGFGEFDFPRGDLDYRRYFLLRERPDGSGRHTLSASTKLGITGPDTPIFENYFAGGFSTMRGFDFRGASPVEGGVQVGGQFSFLNSVEYMFPLTADDMIRGVLFCDFGTVEDSVRIDAEDFRVAPGFGFRINMPFAGSGGAPLAFDFAFPVAKSDTDDTRMFSFYMGVGR